MIDTCAIVILAAGTSSRLGSPKQLLTYKGKTLLRHAADTALGTGCHSVYTILGANIELLKEELKDKPVMIIENKLWKEGIASSIRCALENIAGIDQGPECIIFMVCDQPYITSSLLVSLLEKRIETGIPIVGSRYADKTGTPALFDKSFFPLLLGLKGDSGAGKLISQYPKKTATIPFPEGITDIDTAEDYEILKK